MAGMTLGFGMLVGAGILGAGIAGDGITAGVGTPVGAMVGTTGAGMLVGVMAGTTGAGVLDGAMAGIPGVGMAIIEVIVMPTMLEEEVLCLVTII